jgi:hypothetical protein
VISGRENKREHHDIVQKRSKDAAEYLGCEGTFWRKLDLLGQF